MHRPRMIITPHLLPDLEGSSCLVEASPARSVEIVDAFGSDIEFPEHISDIEDDNNNNGHPSCPLVSTEAKNDEEMDELESFTESEIEWLDLDREQHSDGEVQGSLPSKSRRAQKSLMLS